MCPISLMRTKAVDVARCKALFETVNRHAAAVSMTINASKTKVTSALISVSGAKLSCLMMSPWRMLTNSSTLARCSSQTGRTLRRSELVLILFVLHCLACIPVLGRAMKYRCLQRTGSTRQHSLQRRRLRDDLITAFKIFKGLLDIIIRTCFSFLPLDAA